MFANFQDYAFLYMPNSIRFVYGEDERLQVNTAQLSLALYPLVQTVSWTTRICITHNNQKK